MRSIWSKIILGVLMIGLVVVMSVTLPAGTSWSDIYRPAAWSLVTGKSPYEVTGYNDAPWLLFPLLPLALLPERVGRAAMVLLGIVSMAYAARKLGASRLAIVFFLLSPPALYCHINGEVDWLILLGFILPPRIGIFFMTAKPQMGIAVGIFWLVEAWRDRGWRGVVDLILPIGAAMVLSVIFYGSWFLRGQAALSDLWWSNSLWHLAIPVGLGLLVMAFQRRQIEYAMAASPCLSPFALTHSWIGALLAVVSNTPVLISAVAGLWIAVLL